MKKYIKIDKDISIFICFVDTNGGREISSDAISIPNNLHEKSRVQVEGGFSTVYRFGIVIDEKYRIKK